MSSRSKAQYRGDGAWSEIPPFSEHAKERIRSLLADDMSPADPVWGSPVDRLINEVEAEASWAASELHWHSYDITRQESKVELDDLSRTIGRAIRTLELMRANKPFRKDRGRSALIDANRKLRSISVQCERSLDAGADPLKCADAFDLVTKVLGRETSMTDMHSAVEQSICIAQPLSASIKLARQQLAEPSNPLPSPAEKRAFVAKELAIRVLRVIVRYGVKPASTARRYWRVGRGGDITSDDLTDGGESIYTSKAISLMRAVGDEIGLEMREKSWQRFLLEAKGQLD